MKPDTISLRRRHLLIAGAAAPAILIAAQCGAADNVLAAGLPAAASGGAEKLVVSGRMLDGYRKPLAGALVEVLDSGSNVSASVTTDADGRFMFTSAVPRETINYRVSRKGRETVVRQLHLVHKPGISGDQVAQLHRDDADVWRTTFGLILA